MYSLPLAIWPDALAPVLPQAAIARPTAALPMIAPPAVYGPGLDHVDVSVLPPPRTVLGVHSHYCFSSDWQAQFLSALISRFKLCRVAQAWPLRTKSHMGIRPRSAPPRTPIVGAIMARGALPNLPNWPDCLATCSAAPSQPGSLPTPCCEQCSGLRLCRKPLLRCMQGWRLLS